NNDRQILLSQDKNKVDEYVRLACLTIVFGYKKLFLKITAIIEKNMDKFLKRIDYVSKHFATLNKWVTDFVDNIELAEARNLASEFWEEYKANLDINNFNIRQLLERK
ncbi:MAG: hypothetical protein K2O67_00075, partial [Clostridia bacterium]|nr:hypothetical protein [Clostridia bacterium]